MYVLGLGLSHDSSAVLLRDGELVAAVEEERLDRVKHSEHPPIRAIGHCLETAGIDLAEVDIVAVGSDLEFVDDKLFQQLVAHPDLPDVPSMRALVTSTLARFFGVDVSARLQCVEHHLAHAASAYGLSGFSEALVITLDGGGDGCSGLVLAGHAESLTELHRVRPRASLGHLYTLVTNFLGFRLHDEYKVMGLSSHGDPTRFRPIFDEGIALHDDGSFEVDRHGIVRALGRHVRPRRRGEAVGDAHEDVAAALQEATERVVIHFVSRFQRRTGLRRMCYAGGLAHNCSLNGKLLRHGVVDELFVQPASSDAGLACGAALFAHWSSPRGGFDNRRQPMVYLGPDIGTPHAVEQRVRAWGRLVHVEPSDDVCAHTARLIASGTIVGWVQGRCEYGPRALGHRSILADPRPAENRRRINHAIKKREDFRPFAPAVLHERAREWFELPPGQDDFPHMTAALPVRTDKQHLLGAVTHVDGTARVQTVTARDEPRFHRLIGELEKLTGVPVVLNTSFNNHREPIVTTVDEAVTCLLTTQIEVLIVGDLVVTKTDPGPAQRLAELYVALPFEVPLTIQHRNRTVAGRVASAAVAMLLARADGTTTIGELLGTEALEPDLANELLELWSERALVLSPAPIASVPDTVPRPWLGSWA